MSKRRDAENLRHRLNLASLYAGLVLGGFLMPGAAQAADALVEDITFLPAKSSVVVKSSTPVEAQLTTTSVEDHKRLIVDVQDARIGLSIPRDAVLLKALASRWPAVRNITVSQFGSTHPVVRILIDLDNDRYTASLLQNNTSQLEVKVTEPVLPVYKPALPAVSKKPEPVVSPSVQPEELPSPFQAPFQANVDPVEYQRALNELADKNRALSEKQAQLEQAAGKLIQLDGSLRDLESAKARTAMLTEQVSVLQKQLDELQKANRTLMTENTSRETSRETSLEETRVLREQVTTLQTKLGETTRAYEQEKVALETRVQTLEKQLSASAADKNSDTLKQSLARLTQEQEATQRENLRLKESHDILKKNYDELSEKYKSLAVKPAEKILPPPVQEAPEFQALSEKNRVLSAQLEEQVAYRKRLESALFNANEKNESLTRQLQELGKQSRLSESDRNELTRLTVENKTLAAEVERLGVTSAQAPRLEEKIRVLTAEKQALENQVRSSQSQQTDVKALNLKIQELTAANAALTGNMQKTADTLVKINASNEQLTQQAKQLTEANAVLSQKLNASTDVSRNTQQFEQQVKQLATENASLKEKLSAGESSMTKQQEAMAALTRENGLLIQEKTVLAQQLAAAKSAEPAQQKALADAAAREKAQLEQTAQMEKMAAEIARLSREEKARVQALGEKDKTLSELTARLEALKTQTAEQQKQASKTTAAPGKEAELETLRQQIENLEAEKTVLEQEIAALKSASASVVQTVQSASPDVVDQAEKLYLNGVSLEEKNRQTEALDAYKQAHALLPDNTKYVFAISTLEMKMKNYSAAIELMKALAVQKPEEKEVFNQLGKAYLLNGEDMKALESFRMAIPSDVLSNYATTFKKLGDLEAAEKILKVALELQPDDSDLHFNLGNLYTSRNQLSEAKGAYEQALTLKPDFAAAHYNLGLVYSKMGNNGDAVSHLERFLELSPNAGNRTAVKKYMKKLSAEKE